MSKLSKIFQKCIKSKQIFICLFGIVFANPALSAECVKDVQRLEAGQTSPCPGYLFSDKKEQELRFKDMDYSTLLEKSRVYMEQTELYKQQYDNTQKQVELEAKRADMWQKRAEDSTAKLESNENRTWFRDLAFLGSGVLLTVLAGFALGQVAGH